MKKAPVESLIPYDSIVQEALLAVVGKTLKEVERRGGILPGDHHFYISFKTKGEGVVIPEHLAKRFPDEMTIVLQNKFTDLKVGEDSFSVRLSFSSIPAAITITYLSITAFTDPSVDFGLQFENDEIDIEKNTSGSEGGSGGQDNVIDVDFRRR